MHYQSSFSLNEGIAELACCLQGPDTLDAREDVLQVYISTPLGTGAAQLSLPVVASYLQVRA